MGEHLVVKDDDQVRVRNQDGASSGEAVENGKKAEVVEGASSSKKAKEKELAVEEEEEEEEEEEANEEVPLIGGAECRICQDEDYLNNLESPCACSGSLKYAHRKCVQHWCNEKGDITCEICHQPYQPGYTAPPRARQEETIIDIGGGWQIAGTPLDLHDPRLLAIRETERQLMEAEYDDYSATNASGVAFCRSAALILMAFLLLRHALPVADADGDDEDPSAFFSHFAAAQAKRGGSSISNSTICICGTIWAANRCTVCHGISYTICPCIDGFYICACTNGSGLKLSHTDTSSCYERFQQRASY